MGVGFGSYEIARSGLYVNERGLYVTGHNLSNVGTLGYVRQQAIIATGPYKQEFTKYGSIELGLGADIQQVRQIRHTFLDNIYRRENTSLGYWEARKKTVSDIEGIMGEPMGSGLQEVMNQFWDSWQELSKAPESLTVRALVRQRGEALVHYANHVGTQLDKLQKDLNKEIAVRIEEINQITEQIAGLNTEIMKIEVSNDNANDFRDQRNLLVDRLSKLVDAEVTEMQDGQLTITLGGYYLVNKNENTRLYAGEGGSGGAFYSPKIEGTNIEVPIKSGTLKGLMESRGEVFGASGSVENGSPSTKADIVFALDVSNGSASYLAEVKANMTNYINELKKKGIDYNIRIITYGNNVISNKNYGSDDTSLLADIAAISPTSDTGNNFGGTGGVLDALKSINDFRADSSRQAIIFTGESFDGNEVSAGLDLSGYAGQLKSMGIKTSVVTDKSYFDSGDTAGEAGWSAITSATGGELFDINTASGADYTDMIKQIANFTNKAVNENISATQYSNNIISDLRKKLNALVNVMVREINSMQRSGKTLDGNDGDDFFTVIDSSLPLEMGNIKLNDKLMNLNNIVTSVNGENGDNTIALKIANMRHEPLMGKYGQEISMDDYYRSIVLGIGNIGNEAVRISDNQRMLVQSSDSARQSIMGVSMDEEMSNMMKYKFAYDASSRALNVIDEMMETIISRMGLAGR